MDADILRTILKSYTDADNFVQSEDYKNMSKKTLLCIQSDAALNTLCASLSNLLCYKISKEAYQRYSVRLLIVDVLRNWCRMTDNFKHLKIFTSKENSFKFTSILLEKYLTDDVLNMCYSEDTLICLTISVIHLSVKNTIFMRHVDRLLLRLSQLEANYKIENILYNALCSNLHLKLTTKEEIYALQKFKLIEEPLLNSFVCMFSNMKKEVNNQNNEELLNKLLELSARSAYVFQLMFNFLKELLVQLQYASAVLDFINLMLKRISIYCTNHDKDILDLYPRKLRSCIILLRIKPEYHTVQTQKYTLQTMKELYNENKNVPLILISHFLEWLECFATYVANNIKH
ncbi:PREDICTED: uncharacterized protein LOC108779669 [Cyphomyrmex costatus]|uniref:Uncharacterized protein n=1 Tax=Cyphomyrmex costatus TaxID=456900 RepID=A0A195C7M2_9HYME|nr:PREDICTED: uncharacterized protein LOC108779669 [Cyphomyrmex costatus]KYM96148.1 hypothetical protein ALC62_13199 [Cyphomyrmex costatus]